MNSENEQILRYVNIDRLWGKYDNNRIRDIFKVIQGQIKSEEWIECRNENLVWYYLCNVCYRIKNRNECRMSVFKNIEK